MVIKVADFFDSYNPEKDSLVEMVKNFRGMTGRRLSLLENYLVSEARAAQYYRNSSYGGRVFNLSEEQIKFTYPASEKPGFNYEIHHDQDFTSENDELLNKLVPEITPDEDYFEDNEKPCIYGDEHPMSSSPVDFIRE